MASRKTMRQAGDDDGGGKPPPTETSPATKRWNRVPEQPYPQIVWLLRPGATDDDGANEPRYEDDGKTRHRDMILYVLLEERYNELRQRAPDVELNTLYYLSDNLEDPYTGSDLVYLHQRVQEAKYDGLAFHRKYDIVRPGVHSAELIEAMTDFRHEMDSARAERDSGEHVLSDTHTE